MRHLSSVKNGLKQKTVIPVNSDTYYRPVSDAPTISRRNQPPPDPRAVPPGAGFPHVQRIPSTPWHALAQSRPVPPNHVIHTHSGRSTPPARRVRFPRALPAPVANEKRASPAPW